MNGIPCSARGKEAGDDLTHTNTHVTAANKVSIGSGNDTTLQGALVKAETIQANVGGDLRIESLQDTSTYTSKQSSASASVTEQSGLKAGDGGFQVNVGGDTTLIGGRLRATRARWTTTSTASAQAVNSTPPTSGTRPATAPAAPAWAWARARSARTWP